MLHIKKSFWVNAPIHLPEKKTIFRLQIDASRKAHFQYLHFSTTTIAFISNKSCGEYTIGWDIHCAICDIEFPTREIEFEEDKIYLFPAPRNLSLQDAKDAATIGLLSDVTAIKPDETIMQFRQV